MHYEKYKGAQVRAIIGHNGRKWDTHSNKNIDPAKEHLNFYLHADGYERYQQIMEDVRRRQTVRKDAVTMCEWCLSIPLDWQGRPQEFFDRAIEWFSDRYGEENVINAYVHYDEVRPHLHFEFVPITKDGRLCAKDLETRTSLMHAIEDIETYIESRTGLPCHIQTFESAGKKHLEIAEYKAQQMDDDVVVGKYIKKHDPKLYKEIIGRAGTNKDRIYE